MMSDVFGAVDTVCLTPGHMLSMSNETRSINLLLTDYKLFSEHPLPTSFSWKVINVSEMLHSLHVQL